jgi:hypothetical protein
MALGQLLAREGPEETASLRGGHLGQIEPGGGVDQDLDVGEEVAGPLVSDQDQGTDRGGTGLRRQLERTKEEEGPPGQKDQE